jgi:hypothetical protein
MKTHYHCDGPYRNIPAGLLKSSAKSEASNLHLPLTAAFTETSVNIQ